MTSKLGGSLHLLYGTRDKILCRTGPLAGQQLGLEPMQSGRQRRTPVPPLRRSDQARRRIGREARRVVEVFVARQAAIHGLPEQIRHAELRVQSLSGIVQVAQALIQLTDQNQAGVGGDARSLKRDQTR